MRWFVVLGFAIAMLAGCGNLTAGDPAADGARFNHRFYYYYSETCRYDPVGVFDCGHIMSVSPSYKVGLRVDYDGFATLNLDGDRYYFTEREYSEGYDYSYGAYFRFYEDEDKLDVYKDGYTLALWGGDGYVTFYYYDFPN